MRSRLPALAAGLACLIAGWTVAAAPPTAADAAVWPTWRGPLGTGVSPTADPPLHWSEQQNVRFKVPLPGHGLASPVVWGDRIFLLSAEASDGDAYASAREAARRKLEQREWPPAVNPVRHRFLVMALSRTDGRLLWQRTAAEVMPHESHYIDSSWASASPVVDGKRLIAHFGSNGTYAYDLDGTLLWKIDLGDMTTRRGFGEGASPALHGDTVVINWDHEGESFLVALDAATGKQRWRMPRQEVTSWATPLIVPHAGRHQVIVPATGFSRGYDLETGTEVWRLAGMTVNTIPSPVAADGIVYLTSGYRDNVLQAVALDHASGDLAGTEALLWAHDRHTPYVASILLYDERLYFIKHFRNILSCLRTRTGQPVFDEQRLPGIHNVYASPVAASGRIYIFDRDGHATVLKHGGGFEVLAENVLEEGVDATPALAGRDLLVRGRHHLYALATTAPEGSQQP